MDGLYLFLEQNDVFLEYHQAKFYAAGGSSRSAMQRLMDGRSTNLPQKFRPDGNCRVLGRQAPDVHFSMLATGFELIT